MTGSAVLALAGIPALMLCSVLAGLWLGFRLSIRDAALLASFAKDAQDARREAQAVAADHAALREEVSGVFESVERKRRSAAAAAAKVDQAQTRAAVPVIDEATLSPRERRRLVGRRMNGGL
jgi:hypothetical protein